MSLQRNGGHNRADECCNHAVTAASVDHQRTVGRRMRRQLREHFDERVLERTFPAWQETLQKYVISVFPDQTELVELPAILTTTVTATNMGNVQGKRTTQNDQTSKTEARRTTTSATVLGIRLEA